MTVLEHLRNISAYPVPEAALRGMARGRGLDPDGDGGAVRAGRAFRLAWADVLLWISAAPDVSQGGVSYALREGDRRWMRRRAAELLRGCGEAPPGAGHGLKGERL